MTRGNKNLNHILQTCRTANAAILISVPDPKLIDIQVTERGLIQYWAEVSESLHDYGKNLVKVFRLKRLFRANKMLFMHPRYGDNKIVRYESLNPPQGIIDAYEEMRKCCAPDAGTKYEDRKKADRMAQKEVAAQKREDAMMEVHIMVSQEGKSIGRSIAALNKKFKEQGVTTRYHPATYTRWRDTKGFG